MTSILFFRCCFHAIDERYSPTTFGSSSIKNSLRWCFLFVTLFNLQGTRRYLRNVAILSDFPAFVKHFFLLFQNQVFRTAALSDSLVRISRPPYKVNPFFPSFPKTRHRRVDTHGLHHFPLYSAALFAPTSPFPINRPYSVTLLPRAKESGRLRRPLSFISYVRLTSRGRPQTRPQWPSPAQESAGTPPQWRRWPR